MSSSVVGAIPNRLRSIPGPKAWPIVGALPHYLPLIGRYDPLRILQASRLKYLEFGPIFQERIFKSTILYIVDPVDIETVLSSRPGGSWPARRTHLVMDHVRNHELQANHHNGGIFVVNDESWAHIRHSFQKSMRMEEIGRFVGRGDKIADSLLSRLHSHHVKQHVERDFLDVIFSYTCDYMGMVLFGEEWDSISEYDDPSSISSKLIRASTGLNHATGGTDHGSQLWRIFSTPAYKTILHGARVLDEVGVSRLKSRLREGGRLVGLGGSDALLDTWISGGNNDFKQLLTFIADCILAGIDTIAYSLSFILYHVSRSEVAQDKLHLELKGLSPSGGPLTPQTLSSAIYMRKCMKEGLRLNPLSVGVGRTTREPLCLGGYHIPPGTNVVTLNQLTSRLSEWVERPDDFVPERYGGEGWRKIHPYVALPFSHGPRSCVGRRIAEQSMQIFIFRVFLNYKVEWVGERPLDALTYLINKPDGPLRFKFTPRNTNASGDYK